ncbi:alpha-amylase family protein [Microbacterium koreense]|uniref:Alpha-amylase n=1 Tax=Microbacterium koreense TaxID=323761 RepID=A0ABW2ZPX1_9MICO
MRVPFALVALAATGLLATACTGQGEPERAAPDVGIQLFQLPWVSIADECEQNIGPAGFSWVLTSPPQEHIVGDEWWVSYQPVSHQIESRLGTRDEFADMVQRCGDAGVDVIADAVINHMTGQDAPGVGWAGSSYEHYSYPGSFEFDDFHHCGLTPYDDIVDYGSREQVQTCELVNLADLDTSAPAVRARLGAYLDDLLSLGVAGFRIDAAKHMAADDVAAIVGRLPEGTRILNEVIRGPLEPIQPEEYTGSGEVFEFSYARDLAPQFESGLFSDPDLSDERPMHVPADRAIVFVDNHDTERGEAGLTYRDGDLYLLANVLMLADDYGTPVVYSGYAFSDRDAGPPAESDGTVTDSTCGAASAGDLVTDGERTCVQTWPGIVGMLDWRAVVGDAPRMPGVSAGDAYGFERDGRGVVAVNVGDEEIVLEIPTALPSGDYCDVVAASACDGADITVADGVASVTVPPRAAVAAHLGSRVP